MNKHTEEKLNSIIETISKEFNGKSIDMEAIRVRINELYSEKCLRPGYGFDIKVDNQNDVLIIQAFDYKESKDEEAISA